MKKITVRILLVLTLVLSAGLIVACTDKVDLKGLQSLVDTHETRVESDYTVLSWDDYTKELDAAKVVLTSKPTQKEVDEAKVKLQTAIDGLVKVVVNEVNKAELVKAINEAKEFSLGELTAEELETLNTLIEEAEALNVKTDATQAEVDKMVEDLKALMVVNAEIKWSYPAETYVLTNDIVKFRRDRESLVQEEISKLVTATYNGAEVTVIAVATSLPTLDENNLYTIGEVTVTYRARVNKDLTEETTLTINIVDGKEVDYYFLGLQSANYATPETVGGNANWKGGEGIRVSKDNFFTLNNGTELPENLLVEGKLIDLDDAFTLHNTSNNNITFKNNEITGVHIQMDAAGRVKMMYEGIQNDHWTTEGKFKLTPALFGETDVVLAPGDFYLVVGYTPEFGNYYTEAAGAEFHWRDGRFVARATIGGLRLQASHVAKIVQGETLITDAYENQAPYLSKTVDSVFVPQGIEPTKEMLLEGIEFKDDNGVWSLADVVVSADNITISHNIDINELGDYEVTYEVFDGTLTTVYVGIATVVVNELTNYISYTNKDGVEVIFRDADAVTTYNDVASTNTGNISIYDAEYFNTNKDDATKFSQTNYGVYVLIDKDGNFVESYFNTNYINETTPYGENVSGSNPEATLQALNTLTLEEGQIIMFFQQNGDKPVRQFGQDLRDAFKGRIGEGKITIDTLGLLV